MIPPYCLERATWYPTPAPYLGARFHASAPFLVVAYHVDGQSPSGRLRISSRQGNYV